VLHNPHIVGAISALPALLKGRYKPYLYKIKAMQHSFIAIPHDIYPNIVGMWLVTSSYFTVMSYGIAIKAQFIIYNPPPYIYNRGHGSIFGDMEEK